MDLHWSATDAGNVTMESATVCQDIRDNHAAKRFQSVPGSARLLSIALEEVFASMERVSVCKAGGANSVNLRLRVQTVATLGVFVFMDAVSVLWDIQEAVARTL